MAHLRGAVRFLVEPSAEHQIVVEGVVEVGSLWKRLLVKTKSAHRSNYSFRPLRKSCKDCGARGQEACSVAAWPVLISISSVFYWTQTLAMRRHRRSLQR
jgi:hypothetical protein